MTITQTVNGSGEITLSQGDQKLVLADEEELCELMELIEEAFVIIDSRRLASLNPAPPK